MPKTKLKQNTRRDQLEAHLKEVNKQDGIQRHPRPLGLTLMNLTRINNEKQGIKQEGITPIKKLCIQLYIREGFRWMNKTQSINQMAMYLNIPSEQLLRESNRELERISAFFEGPEGKHLARGMAIKALNLGLEILAQCQSQVSLLLAQQNGKYVPFLSGEVNKALTNLIGAQKPLHDILAKFNEKSPINLLIANNGQSATSGKEYLSPEDALLMIQNNSPSMASSPQLVEAKEAELGALPDVNARNQDLSKIGIKIPNKVISKDGTQLHEDLKAEDFLQKEVGK